MALLSSSLSSCIPRFYHPCPLSPLSHPLSPLPLSSLSLLSLLSVLSSRDLSLSLSLSPTPSAVLQTNFAARPHAHSAQLPRPANAVRAAAPEPGHGARHHLDQVQPSLWCALRLALSRTPHTRPSPTNRMRLGRGDRHMGARAAASPQATMTVRSCGP